MNPAGNVLYALDRTSGQIGQFRIMRDGNLQRMARLLVGLAVTPPP
jgi:hypothetical protein